MILRVKDHEFSIPKTRKITHETFTLRYKLESLETELMSERKHLDQLPGNQRRRQREKIFRLESRIDILRLKIVANG